VLCRSEESETFDVSRQKLVEHIEPMIRAHEVATTADAPYLSDYADGAAILMNAVYTSPIFDYVGAIYSLYAAVRKTSRYPGEYYTPADVAQLLTAIAIEKYRAQLRENLLQATTEAVTALLARRAQILGHGLAGLIGSRAEVELTFQAQLLPLIAPHMKPINIYDPCCGSGSLLLAAARQFPAWANSWGFVRYYGQDQSKQAVRLARLNCRLFGLNGRMMVEAGLTSSLIQNEAD
jgi:methylase of polypeptide subunit release factors